jgi:hypothetical protein
MPQRIKQRICSEFAANLQRLCSMDDPSPESCHGAQISSGRLTAFRRICLAGRDERENGLVAVVGKWKFYAEGVTPTSQG